MKMQRRKIVLIAILMIMFLMTSLMQIIDLADANYYPPPSIEIPSPVSAPRIYKETSIPLQVTVNIFADEPDIVAISYSLDGEANITLTDLTRTDGVSYWTTEKGVFIQGTAFRAESFLENLVEGKHTVTVYSHDTEGKEMSESREFTVDYDYLPPQSTSSASTNHTATPAPTNSQTETATPTINTGSMQPSETSNPLLLIVIVAVVASAIATALYFSRKCKGKSNDG